MNIGEAVGRGVVENLPEQGEGVDRNDSRIERTKARVELLVVKGHESGKRGRNYRIAGATCKRRLARIDQVEDHDMASAGLLKTPDMICIGASRRQSGGSRINRSDTRTGTCGSLGDGQHIVRAAPNGIKGVRVGRPRGP